MKLHSWMGLGAAQASSKAGKPKDRRQQVISLGIGVLLALVIAVGLFILLPISITAP